MVHVGKVKVALQGRVDGGRDRLVADGALGVEVNHLIFGLDAAVDLLELQQFFQIESGEAGELDATKVAAAALDPEDSSGCAVGRIDPVQLGAGVAAAEVGDVQVRPQQIRPVAQQLGRVKLCGDRFVPFVLEKLKFCVRCHDADLNRDRMSPTIIPRDAKTRKEADGRWEIHSWQRSGWVSPGALLYAAFRRQTGGLSAIETKAAWM